MARANQPTYETRVIAISATVVLGAVALFVPFIPAIISAALAVKLKSSNAVWARNVVIANIVIIVVNLAITAIAIHTGSMLRGVV